ncbi:hypothetical protein EDE08_104420 [Bradyrhizobium sp. R2.2-H]|nr:hypothetical protein EDE10_104222 [Bradyrhizobium sp. Y-H1]TCU76254.1 hypothetical protein EDE08_104420 [Bradyrhizobium sp. R2.2-H]
MLSRPHSHSAPSPLVGEGWGGGAQQKVRIWIVVRPQPESLHLAAPSVKAVSITSPNGCQERPSNWTSRICLIGR